MRQPYPACPEIENTSVEARLASMKRRVEDRRTYINAKMDKVLRREVTEKNLGGEELRLWLEKFTLHHTTGVDICCGNFLVGNSIGIDSAFDVIGNHYNFRGDDLTTFAANSLEYVVCDYFDCFDSPLKVLNEWHRALKPGGKVAFTCSNAECYPDTGDLLNGKRRFLYTQHTITQFVNKVFGNCDAKTHKTALLVSAAK